MTCCNTKKRTWRFDNPEQTTASNTIREIVGFSGSIFMSFESALRLSVLNPNIDPFITITPSDYGLLIGSISNDAITVDIPIQMDITGSYMFVITAVSIGGEELIRRGLLVVESLTGT